MTKQRQAVYDELGRIHDFRSAQQIYERLRTHGQKIGLATVYRNLQSLAEAHEVDVLRSSEGEALYRRCGSRSHHHHLVCRTCGYTQEIAQKDIETWVSEVAQSHSFTAVEHSMELFGLCERCTKTVSTSGEKSKDAQ